MNRALRFLQGQRWGLAVSTDSPAPWGSRAVPREGHPARLSPVGALWGCRDEISPGTEAGTVIYERLSDGSL